MQIILDKSISQVHRCKCNYNIYIYAFSRRFYPKRLTVHSGYTFSLVCVFPGNRTHNLLPCWRNALPLSHTGTHYKYEFQTFSTEVMNTEQPMRRKIMRPVIRCSLIPRNLGCSPGAEHSDSSFRLLTWEMDRTVAATNHGSPIREQTPSIKATMNKSRW